MVSEVETAVRMTSWDETMVQVEDRKFIERKIVPADSGSLMCFISILKVTRRRYLPAQFRGADQEPGLEILSRGQAMDNTPGLK
jgi:hypothetical protein